MDYLKLKHLWYWLFIAKQSGLKPRKTKPIDVGIFGWGDYKPKHERLVIPTLSIKDQKQTQCCQWFGSAVQKEVDEKKILSVASIVAKAVQMGLTDVASLGLSSMEDGQQVMKEWGIAEESLCPTDAGKPFDQFVNDVDLPSITDNAKIHKIKTSWGVSSDSDCFKLLDEGHVLNTGMKWYTGFNQGGGFKAPWIISGPAGWYVGGHATPRKGYDLNYYGKQVWIHQNSYGPLWGDHGDFYIEMDAFDKLSFGIEANLDLDNTPDLITNIKSMLANTFRCLEDGSFWFVKDGSRQKIETIGGMMTILDRTFGSQTIKKDDLNKLPTKTFFGATDGIID